MSKVKTNCLIIKKKYEENETEDDETLKKMEWRGEEIKFWSLLLSPFSSFSFSCVSSSTDTVFLFVEKIFKN